MLYDRPYMRQSPGTTAKKPSVVTSLLLATIGVFILQQVLNVFFPGYGGRQNHFMTEWFALNGPNFKELKVWTVLSYSFIHSTQSIWHILGNMLGLFFIGRIIEPIIGKQQFLLLYIGSALLGGLLFLFLHYNETTFVVGASAAVLGVITLFCRLRPEQPITLLLFFVLPVTIKPKWLFWGMLGFSVFGVLFDELPAARNPGYSTMGVAHSAHLGGIVAGILYFRYVYSGSVSFFKSNRTKPAVELPEWFKRKQKSPRKVTYKVNRRNRDALQKEVDRILDKINATGFGSLSSEEKTTLDQAKDILKK
jgi:membrane associated rhomboid family serine protease